MAMARKCTHPELRHGDSQGICSICDALKVNIFGTRHICVLPGGEIETYWRRRMPAHLKTLGRDEITCVLLYENATQSLPFILHPWSYYSGPQAARRSKMVLSVKGAMVSRRSSAVSSSGTSSVREGKLYIESRKNGQEVREA